jgi:CCR4-NOT transcription complex subunit 6
VVSSTKKTDRHNIPETLLNVPLNTIKPNQTNIISTCFVGLQGNPLSPEIMNLYNSNNGTQKLLSFMLDNLAGQLIFIVLMEYLA